MNRKSILQLTLVLSLMFALTLTLSSTALAHSRLKSSTPSDGETLTAAPSTVTATFGEETSPTQSYIKVYNGNTQVDNGDGKVDANDRTKMSVTLKSGLGDGTYTVKWHTVTEDDNGIADGSFSYTVKSDGTASGPTGSTGTMQESGEGTSGSSNTMPTTGAGDAWLLTLAILALLTLVAGFATRRRATLS